MENDEHKDVDLDQNNDLDLDLDLEPESTDPLDAITDVEELRKRAKGYRSVANRKKKPDAKPQPQEHIKNSDRTYNILEDDVASFLLEGYSKDEVKFILANGGREALQDKDSYVAIAINTKRDQRKAEQAASQTSFGSGMTEVERKFTPEQLKNMSSEELKEILPHSGN